MINIEQLKMLLADGKSVSETAKIMGVFNQNIYYYIHKLNLTYRRTIPEYHGTPAQFNAEKVAKIKEQIKNGTYVIDAGNIADKIISALKND